METNNENSLEMLERLLHDEIRPHSTLGLPSEPQVMRTKRMGHRKAQSISFLQQGKQPVLLSAQGNHKRNSSLSGLSETSDFKVPALNQPYQLPAHPLSGHRRFHSVGGQETHNANMTYQFPSSQSTPQEASTLPFQPPFAPENSLSYTFPGIGNGHQKSLSGTSEMFNEFVVMNLEKDEPLSQRPMTRLHPLMQDSHYPSNDQGYEDLRSGYPDDLHSGYPDESRAGYIPASARNDELYFNDESGHNEEEFGFSGNQFHNADDYQQVVTACTWAGCNRDMHTQEALVNHILQDHVGTGKASYTCEWEGCARMQKPFSKRHKIQNHIRIHTGERPFACPIADCGKKFSRQDGLNTHIKTHSSVKPYVCSFSNCGKAYFHSRSLRKHERTHIDSPNNSYTDSPSSNHNYNATQEPESQFGIYASSPYIPSYQQQDYTQEYSSEYNPQSEFQPSEFQAEYKPEYVSHDFSLPQEEYGLMELAALSSANPGIQDPPVGVEGVQQWAGFVEG